MAHPGSPADGVRRVRGAGGMTGDHGCRPATEPSSSPWCARRSGPPGPGRRSRDRSRRPSCRWPGSRSTSRLAAPRPAVRLPGARAAGRGGPARRPGAGAVRRPAGRRVRPRAGGRLRARRAAGVPGQGGVGRAGPHPGGPAARPRRSPTATPARWPTCSGWPCPPRHARVEAAAVDGTEPPARTRPAGPRGLGALRRRRRAAGRRARRRHRRAVWSALPGPTWPDELARLVATALAGGRGRAGRAARPPRRRPGRRRARPRWSAPASTSC